MNNQAWIVTALVALLTAGVAFYVGRSTASESEVTVSGVVGDTADTVAAVDEELEPTADTTGGARLNASETREAHLLKEIEREQARVKDLEAEVAALKEGAAEPAPEAEAVAGARYVYPGTTKITDVLDVAAAGKALAAMSPILGEFMTSLAAGEPNMKLQARIQQHNSVLVSQALKLQGEDVSGHGINGGFTHPAVQVNLIYSTLLSAEVPLTESQEERLGAIGDEFVKAEASRVAGYQDGTFTLQKLVDEGALKDRFYAAVDAMMTAGQMAVLHPDGTAGRLRTDLFSSGLVWATVAGTAAYTTRESLSVAVTARAMQQFQLGSEHESLVGSLASEYAEGFSNAYIDYAPDDLDRMGLLKVGRVQMAAEHMLKFFRALADRLPVDQKTQDRIRKTGRVLVPVKSK